MNGSLYNSSYSQKYYIPADELACEEFTPESQRDKDWQFDHIYYVNDDVRIKVDFAHTRTEDVNNIIWSAILEKKSSSTWYDVAKYNQVYPKDDINDVKWNYVSN